MKAPDIRLPLSREQVAKYLGVSVGTVDNMRKRQGLPAMKIGTRVVFRPEAVEAWAARRQEGADRA
jgi:excisionase family DNA binding protein